MHPQGPGKAYGGMLYAYDGAKLVRHPESAVPELIDLSAASSELCFAKTGANPVRPHMMAMNADQTHAILSFVASGHVLIMEAAATNIDAMGVERADVHALTIRVPPRKRHGRH